MVKLRNRAPLALEALPGALAGKQARVQELEGHQPAGARLLRQPDRARAATPERRDQPAIAHLALSPDRRGNGSPLLDRERLDQLLQLLASRRLEVSDQ